MKKCTLDRQKETETRTKEHFRNVRLNHLEKSAIASHVMYLHCWFPPNNIINILFEKQRGIRFWFEKFMTILLIFPGKLGEGDRRPASIPARSPDHRVTNESPRRKSSTDCSGHQTSPSYCIKDMAALFENRRDPSSQPSSRPTATGKQYLSSV